MAEQDASKLKPAGGTQSGGPQPRNDDTNPLHDPSSAGADLYNSGNKTGNPVKSNEPGTGQTGPGVNADKAVPMRDRQDTTGGEDDTPGSSR